MNDEIVLADGASEDLNALRRELRGVQEMLAFVLHEIGEPVVITKKTLTSGLPNGAQICVDENIAEETFTFRLEIPVEQ